MMKRLVIISTLSLAFFILSTHNAQAQISISPLTFELSANPGSRISNVLTVFNQGDTPLSISMEAQSFRPVGEQGQVAVQELRAGEDNTGYELSEWITMQPRSIVLEPHTDRTVTFIINVPRNAEPGGHYGSVLAGIGGTGFTAGGSLIAQKVGALVLLQVSGDVVEKIDVKSFEAPTFSEYGPVTITTRFENIGTVHLKPQGFIVIKNIFGREIITLQLPAKNVLPNSIRKIETIFDKKFLFGKYDAILTAVYGSQNQQQIAYATSFYVIPWKMTLLYGILGIIVLILFWRARKRIKLALKILLRGHQD